MVRAKKHLGQNFLKDKNILKSIAEAAEISPTEHIVEVGPGEGDLTEELVQRAGKVTAVEMDDDLIPFLKIQFKGANHFTLIHGDALQFIPPSEPYKVVANIPYYITSPLLNHFLKEQFMHGNPPRMLVLMVQKEVAEKIVAADGKHSLLSLEVQLFGKVSYIKTVPAGAFRPKPQVDSAVIKIEVYPEPQVNGDLKKLFWLFKAGLAQKRKKLSNNLAAALHKKPAEVVELLKNVPVDLNARAEILTFTDWQHLLHALGSVLPAWSLLPFGGTPRK